MVETFGIVSSTVALTLVINCVIWLAKSRYYWSHIAFASFFVQFVARSALLASATFFSNLVDKRESNVLDFGGINTQSD